MPLINIRSISQKQRVTIIIATSMQIFPIVSTFSHLYHLAYLYLHSCGSPKRHLLNLDVYVDVCVCERVRV